MGKYFRCCPIAFSAADNAGFWTSCMYVNYAQLQIQVPDIQSQAMVFFFMECWISWSKAFISIHDFIYCTVSSLWFVVAQFLRFHGPHHSNFILLTLHQRYIIISNQQTKIYVIYTCMSIKPVKNDNTPQIWFHSTFWIQLLDMYKLKQN